MRWHIRRRRQSWQSIVVMTESRTGKQRQLSGTRDTGREAGQLLLRLLAQAGSSSAAGSCATVAQLMGAWQELNASGWSSPGTARQTRAVVRRYTDPCVGSMLVRNVRTTDCDALYVQLQSSGGREDGPLASTTARKVHNAFRSALAQAVRWEWIFDNPAARATPPTEQPARVAPLRPSDVVRYPRAIAGDLAYGDRLVAEVPRLAEPRGELRPKGEMPGQNAQEPPAKGQTGGSVEDGSVVQTPPALVGRCPSSWPVKQHSG